MERKLFKYLFLFLAIFSGCAGFEDDDLFGEPASKRLEQNRLDILSELESSSEGWLLQYFPHPNQIYGGINYFLKFKEGKVVATIEGTQGEVESSYQIISRGGSVITFNQYNELLHKYAVPSGAKPEGDQGDFEFLVLSYENGVYNLKGLRTGNYCRLLKINENVQSLESKIDQVKATSLDGLIFNEETNLKGEISKSTKQISFDTENGVLSQRFIYTENGIRLYDPITINGNVYQEFVWNAKDKLYRPIGETNAGFRVIQAPIDFSKRWSLVIDPQKDNACQEIKDLQNKIQADILTQYPGVFLYYQYDFGTLTGKMYGMRFDVIDANTFTVYGATYNATFKGVIGDENALEFVPNFYYTESQGSYWEYFPSLNEILNKFASNSPYTVTKIDEERRKLVSKENPEFWFVLGPPPVED
ncbi:DUF4302 domain-containing protein [Ornithobacterium rhinotracheale]|uniref:DUF4302 domain-containing protein n=1 Tax=Ornithobacterium rhinotracheale TaxID=28251 RepID=A0A3R5X072_ORNRH|nr:DUF4302 domain-containing protein [Ornithobacterium rhinotracheale]QAR31271.1 DUF4302 domain-containing protein [Ornithobacterium rhinotracheale]